MNSLANEAAWAAADQAEFEADLAASIEGNDMTDLLDLATRLEQAKGPDRELDALLHCVREELGFILLAKGGEIYGEICDPTDGGFGTANTCTPGLLYARFPDHKNPPTLGGGRRGNKVQGCTPDRFTASIDAAMTLVPEGCLQPSDIVREAVQRLGKHFGLHIAHWPLLTPYGPTLARFVAAAALRARHAQGGE